MERDSSSSKQRKQRMPMKARPAPAPPKAQGDPGGVPPYVRPSDVNALQPHAVPDEFADAVSRQ